MKFVKQKLTTVHSFQPWNGNVSKFQNFFQEFGLWIIPLHFADLTSRYAAILSSQTVFAFVDHPRSQPHSYKCRPVSTAIKQRPRLLFFLLFYIGFKGRRLVMVTWQPFDLTRQTLDERTQSTACLIPFWTRLDKCQIYKPRTAKMKKGTANAQIFLDVVVSDKGYDVTFHVSYVPVIYKSSNPYGD